MLKTLHWKCASWNEYTQPITGVSLPWHTDNGEELVGAAVREEAAHRVPTWEGGQTFLAVLMGLEVEDGEETERMKMGSDTDFTRYSTGLC